MHNYFIKQALQRRNQLEKSLKEIPLTPETENIIKKLFEIITALQIELENLFGERYD